jgi:hypothetical protein
MPVSNYGSGNYGASTFGRSVVDGAAASAAISVVTATFDRLRFSGSSISSVATAAVDALYIRQSSAAMGALVTTSVDSDVIVNGQGSADATASLAAVNYLRIRKASGSTAPVATFTASGRHKWQDITSATGGAWENEVDTPVVWTELESPYR